MALPTQKVATKVQSRRVTLSDGKETTVHVVRYERAKVRPRVILFKKPTRLLDWCKKNEVQGAIVGGFFWRSEYKPLGEHWLSGKEIDTVPFMSPWNKIRGSVYIDTFSGLEIGSRQALPKKPSGDLLQAGPLLVQRYQSLVQTGQDIEGFSKGSGQFDSDITIGRYPRAAIGSDDQYIWSVVCDGRSQDEAGLTFSELADVMVDLGVESALNLDGGGSASLVHEKKLLNVSRTPGYIYPRGRKIYSAIAFDAAE